MSDKFKYEKQMIGYLLKHYYKESNYSLEEFINGNDTYLNTMCNQCNKCNKPDRICSKNTLYRLFDGSIISNECVYYRLANKLNKEVILDRYDIYEKLEDYRELLVNNIVDFSKNNLEKLESLILVDLKKYKNTLLVYELLSLYLNLIKDKLYLGSSPKKEEISIYHFLKDLIHEDDKKIILYYFYTGKFVWAAYGMDYQQNYKETEIYIDEPLFYERKLDCVYYMDQLNSYNYLINEEMPKINKLSSYHQYWLYRKLQIVQVNSEAFSDSYETMLKCYDIMQNNDFSTPIIFNTYLRLGFISYCLKNYDASINWLLKAFNIRKSLTKDLLILCSSLEKLGKIDELKIILNETDIKSNKSNYSKMIYTYYKIKHQKENKSKQEIIEL